MNISDVQDSVATITEYTYCNASFECWVKEKIINLNLYETYNKLSMNKLSNTREFKVPIA